MDLSNDQLKIVKSMMVPSATQEHLQYFKMVCKARDLDPFAGHCVLEVKKVKQRDGSYAPKPMITTTIDGARTKAAKTGEYAGSDKAVFDFEEELGLTCEKTVYRLVNGQKCGFTAELAMKEFHPPSGFGDRQWKKMPRHMLAKCTEMAALRMGFPETCGGEYEQAEHILEDEDQSDGPAEIPEGPSNDIRWQKVKAAFAEFGVDEQTILETIKKEVKDLNDEDFEGLHDWYVQCQENAAGVPST